MWAPLTTALRRAHRWRRHLHSTRPASCCASMAGCCALHMLCSVIVIALALWGGSCSGLHSGILWSDVFWRFRGRRRCQCMHTLAVAWARSWQSVDAISAALFGIMAVPHMRATELVNMTYLLGRVSFVFQCKASLPPWYQRCALAQTTAFAFKWSFAARRIDTAPLTDRTDRQEHQCTVQAASPGAQRQPAALTVCMDTYCKDPGIKSVQLPAGADGHCSCTGLFSTCHQPGRTAGLCGTLHGLFAPAPAPA